MRVDLTRSQEKWPLRVRLQRILWQGFFSFFARYMPRPCNGLRIRLLRAAGASIGEKCLIMPGIKVLMPWNLEIGDCVAIGRDVELYNHARISIRPMTLISQYSFLCTSSHDYTEPFMPLIYHPIEIGSECWIAADVFIGPGVTVGDGSVIGACSVVSRSMPPWMICAGNPCKPIRPREIKANAALDHSTGSAAL